MELKIRSHYVHQRRLKQIFSQQAYGIDNQLKVKYSMDVLRKHGQFFEVGRPKKKSQFRKLGSCYGNAATKQRRLNYQYVEGVITCRSSGLKISHAWNIDLDGNHVDFTLRRPDEFEYNGIIIPAGLRFTVGLTNGGLDYCVLPFLK